MKKVKHEGHEVHQGEKSFYLKALILRDLCVISTGLIQAFVVKKVEG